MKKLMIAAAIVCAAAYAQASTYDWSASAPVYMAEGEGFDGFELDGSSVYVFDANVYSLIAFTQDITTKGVSEAIGNALTPNEGEIAAVDYQQFAFSGTGIGDDGGTEKQYINAYVAVISTTQEDGKQYFHVYEIDPIQVNAVVTASGATIDIGEQYISELPGAGSTYWTVAAPEPTSGLLLLIGVAGMALRRRRA